MSKFEFRPISTATLGVTGRIVKESFSVAVSEQNGCTLVELAGRFLLGEATSAIRAVFQELHTLGALCILLDLSDVTHLDSAGLGEIAHLSTITADAGGRIFAVRPRRSYLYSLLLETKVAAQMHLSEWRDPALQAAERWMLGLS
jgi:anti-anti-sigma regulatory factor